MSERKCSAWRPKTVTPLAYLFRRHSWVVGCFPVRSRSNAPPTKIVTIVIGRSDNLHSLGGVVAQICIGGGIQLLPLAWKKLVYSIGRMRARAGKDVSEIFEWIDVIQFTAGHKAVNNSGSPSTGIVSIAVGGSSPIETWLLHALQANLCRTYFLT